MNYHSFGVTGLTSRLSNGGALVDSRASAAHEPSQTTRLYDRADEGIVRLVTRQERRGLPRSECRARPMPRDGRARSLDALGAVVHSHPFQVAVLHVAQPGRDAAGELIALDVQEL